MSTDPRLNADGDESGNTPAYTSGGSTGGTDASDRLGLACTPDSDPARYSGGAWPTGQGERGG